MRTASFSLNDFDGFFRAFLFEHIVVVNVIELWTNRLLACHAG